MVRSVRDPQLAQGLRGVNALLPPMQDPNRELGRPLGPGDGLYPVLQLQRPDGPVPVELLPAECAYYAVVEDAWVQGTGITGLRLHDPEQGQAGQYDHQDVDQKPDQGDGAGGRGVAWSLVEFALPLRPMRCLGRLATGTPMGQPAMPPGRAAVLAADGTEMVIEGESRARPWLLIPAMGYKLTFEGGRGWRVREMAATLPVPATRPPLASRPGPI